MTNTHPISSGATIPLSFAHNRRRLLLPYGKTLRLVGLAVGALLTSGCETDQFPVAPVSGTITMDGKPLVGCQVGFEPLQSDRGINVGPGSYALTDQSGHYELETLDGLKGAVIGPHLVWVRSFSVLEPDSHEEMPAVPREKIPTRYNNPSTLRFDVPPEGSANADFALSSK